MLITLVRFNAITWVALVGMDQLTVSFKSFPINETGNAESWGKTSVPSTTSIPKERSWHRAFQV